jgi:hypothetical protein
VVIIEDEVVDISGISQISSVLRYVTPDGCVQERFISLSGACEDHSAVSLSRPIFNLMNKFQSDEHW